MKANEEPKKLYLLPNGLISYCRNTDEDVEYTHTDAFIEKACEVLKKLMYDNLMFQGRLHREEIINSIIEDFKKYMKGGEA